MKNTYFSAFETTGEKYFLKHNETKVYLATFLKNENEYKIFYNIEDYINNIMNYKNIIVYFHNLKFDGSFIADYILSKRPDLKIISTIDNTKKWYSLKIMNNEQFKYYNKYYSMKNKKSLKKPDIICNFKDSLKLLPTTIEKLGKILGENKIENYNYDRENYELTKEDIKYCIRDTVILQKSIYNLSNFAKNYNVFELPLTLGKLSQKIFMKYFSSYECYKSIFPNLDKSFIDNLRKNYRGGYCYVNPVFQNEIVNNISSIDINSSYPSIMKNYFLPFGKIIKIDKAEDIKNQKYFKILEVELFNITCKLYPFLFIKRGFTNEYIYNSKYLKIMLIEDEYNFILKYYKIEKTNILNVYYFKKSNNIFNSFVYDFYEAKNKSTCFQKLFYKLILNSLYGKFGENTKKITSKLKGIDEKYKFLYHDEEYEKENNLSYLPVAFAITSFGRLKLFEEIVKYKNNFLYCDTDSIYFKKECLTENLSEKIGDWKLELKNTRAKFLKQKTYAYNDNNILKLKVAGLVKSNIKSLNEFNQNITIDEGTLIPKKVKGGVLLLQNTFTIK